MNRFKERLKTFLRNLEWNDQIVTWVTLIAAHINFGLAIAILAGGLPRMSGPSYEPLLAYSHGQVWVWGLVAAFSGGLVLARWKSANVFGLWLGMVWHILFMACFLQALFESPTAAATPIPMYGGMAAMFAALLTDRVIRKP